MSVVPVSMAPVVPLTPGTVAPLMVMASTGRVQWRVSAQGMNSISPVYNELSTPPMVKTPPGLVSV